MKLISNRSTVLAVRLSIGALLTAALAIAASGPASVAPAATAATASKAKLSYLRVQSGPTALRLTWTATGAAKVSVTVGRQGAYGPTKPYSVKPNVYGSLTIPFRNLPFRNVKGATGSYWFTVTAWDKAGHVTRSSTWQTHIAATGVSTANKSAAGKKIEKCLKQGFDAAMVTVTAGGVYKLVSLAIPGVDGVSAATTAATTIAAGTGGTVYCGVKETIK